MKNTFFGNISAVPQTKRSQYLPQIVARGEWHRRLLNGSNYPLPVVIPLFSVDTLVERQWLKASEASVLKQLRDYNPLMFDFVLKRSLRIQGARRSDSIFDTGILFVRAKA